MHKAIVSAIYSTVNSGMQATYPTIPVALENQAFDYANPPPAYVEVEVKFYDANQIGASSSPKTRVAGYVYVTYVCREGAGTLAGLDILDYVAGLLKYKSIGAARLQAPTLQDSIPPKGWHIDELKVPFYADEP